MNTEQRAFFRDELRTARGAVLGNGEDFLAVLLVLERLGRYLYKGKGDGLGKYWPVLRAYTARSPLADELPSSFPECHVPAVVLYEDLRKARNEVVHEGAFARNVGSQAVFFAIILEDGLMADMESIGHFMVRSPICASFWQPISLVRQTLLASSFSYLPVNVGTERVPQWRLVSDLEIARYLRADAALRKERLKISLETAVADDGLELVRPYTCTISEPVTTALERSMGFPMLVLAERDEQLIGIVTAFDML